MVVNEICRQDDQMSTSKMDCRGLVAAVIMAASQNCGQLLITTFIYLAATVSNRGITLIRRSQIYLYHEGMIADSVTDMQYDVIVEVRGLSLSYLNTLGGCCQAWIFNLGAKLPGRKATSITLRHSSLTHG